MSAVLLVALALAAALGLAACNSTSLAEDAIRTCGKGHVAYVDTNSQQFGCKR